MKLTIIGCSGSLPGPGSAASCYLLEDDGFALVLDLGSGAAGPLQRHVGLDSIGAVVLSHLHPDHCLDLCGVYVARKYGARPVADRLAVYGPSGVASRIAAAYGPTDGAGVAAVFAFTEIGAGTSWELGPFAITAHPVLHPVEAYAYRIQAGGRTFAYSGDCAPCEGVSAAVESADLALVEAAFVDGRDNPPGHHHTAREAGELARAGGVGRLVITHVPPWYDGDDAAAVARTAFSGPVDPARPGATYEV